MVKITAVFFFVSVISAHKTTSLKMLAVEKKDQFFCFLVCSLPSNKKVKINKEKKSVMTKIRRKIKDVSCINVQVIKGVVLQQHCPCLHLTLLQDYVSSRKHNIWVL